MTQTNISIDYQKYDAPSEIINDDSLTRAQKINLLKTWAADATALARASAEGLNGGEQGQLKSVNKALHALKNSNA